MRPRIDGNELEFVRRALIIDPRVYLDELVANITYNRRVNVSVRAVLIDRRVGRRSSK